MTHPSHPFACVIWDDAHGSATEQFTEDELMKKHRGARFQSYGWLIRSDEVGVTLVSEWEPAEKSYRAQMFVPRGMVVEEHLFSLVKPRKKRVPPTDPAH